MLKLQSPLPSHEELFMQRYERLLGWALQVTDHDRARAEDLVHDIFIQFTLSQPDTERLYNIDGYLYTMLRNMHLSQLRRATRLRDAAPSLADFDSAELGIRTIDPRNQIQVREELRLICQYACNRRHSSKAGSVLILRFFHGYYPGEIACILRTTCAAVDQWLRIARREVRLYLNDRDSLTFINAGAETVISYPGHAISQTDDALAQLRNAIFNTNGTTCLSKEELRQQFASGIEGTLDNKLLSHVATCASCLDEVNRLLGLPPLSERHPTDHIGPDRDVGGGDGPRGPGASSAATFTRKSRRQRKDVIEHRPQELRIAVNGFVLGSQKVSSEVSELSLSISQTEKLGFVEVFSEQEVRMLFLSVEPPPDGQAEYKEEVALSDGRTIELALRFSETWPNVDVVYRDPSLAVAPFLDPELQAAGADSTAGSRGSSPTVTEGTDVSPIKPRRRFSLAWSNLRRHLPNLKLELWNLKLFSRPAVVTVLLAAVLLALVFIARRAPTPLLTANDLLARAAAAEDVQLARTDQVLHRTISLEEKSSTGALIARRRIEVWHSGERGVTARRLYDERGALVSGDWRRSDGVQTLYHHGARPQLQLNTARSAIRTFDDIWHLDPSAKDFALLIGGSETARFEERGDAFVIYAESAGSVNTPTSRSSDRVAPSSVDGFARLKKATLVLSKADLHPIEQSLVIRQGDEIREFRFVEISFERRPPNSVPPAVFEPDADLLTGDTGTRRHGDTEISASPRLPVTASPVLANAALEVEVLRLLNQAGADTGEQINVTRAPDGRLNVHGVIETAQRKQEILAALRPVAGNPAVHIEINTVAEALKKLPTSSQRATEVVVENTQPTANAIPVDAEVRRYLSARGVSPGQMEDEVRHFANQIVSRSRQAMYHAAAMKRLAERFSPDEVRTLDNDAQTKWLSLIRQHARSFLNDSVSLRQDLAPVFSATRAGESEGGEIADTDALIRSVTHLFEISAANYNAIQSAFTVSSSTSTSSALKSAQFWRSMREAESLAGKIAASQSLRR